MIRHPRWEGKPRQRCAFTPIRNAADAFVKNRKAQWGKKCINTSKCMPRHIYIPASSVSGSSTFRPLIVNNEPRLPENTQEANDADNVKICSNNAQEPVSSDTFESIYTLIHPHTCELMSFCVFGGTALLRGWTHRNSTPHGRRKETVVSEEFEERKWCYILCSE